MTSHVPDEIDIRFNAAIQELWFATDYRQSRSPTLLDDDDLAWFRGTVIGGSQVPTRLSA